MKIVKQLSYFDLVAILLAVLLPNWFVSNSFDVLSMLEWHFFSVASAYGVIVVFASATASIIRHLMAPSGIEASTYSRGRLILSLLVSCVLAFMIWNLRGVGELSADEVSSPYVPYLISVMFCAGAGYALAYLVLSFFQSIRSEK